MLYQNTTKSRKNAIYDSVIHVRHENLGPVSNDHQIWGITPRLR